MCACGESTFLPSLLPPVRPSFYASPSFLLPSFIPFAYSLINCFITLHTYVCLVIHHTFIPQSNSPLLPFSLRHTHTHTPTHTHIHIYTYVYSPYHAVQFYSPPPPLNTVLRAPRGDGDIRHRQGVCKSIDTRASHRHASAASARIHTPWQP